MNLFIIFLVFIILKTDDIDVIMTITTVEEDQSIMAVFYPFSNQWWILIVDDYNYPQIDLYAILLVWIDEKSAKNE